MLGSQQDPSEQQFSQHSARRSSADAPPDRERLNSRHRDRLREIFESEKDSSAKIRAALRFGAERLGTEFGQLARIDVADGKHVVTEAGGPMPQTEQGDEHALSKTFCRTVLGRGDPLAIHDAPEEGWTEDPAYEHFGLACYLGTKVLVDGSFYGTVCFTGTEPRDTHFEEADEIFVELLAQQIGRELERAEREDQLVEARHRVERAEDLLQHVQKVANVGGWQLDVQNWTTSLTNKARRMLGLGDAYDATIGTIMDRLPEEGQSRLRLGLVQAIRDETPFTFKTPLEGPQDTEWAEVHGLPYAKDKRVTKIIGTVRDITTYRQRLQEIKEARRESLVRLSRAAEHRDFETGAHIRRVGHLSSAIAEALGKDPAWQARIEEAAMLHDVGKIGIPDRVLLKEAPLTNEEYKKMKRHTLIGADLLSGEQSDLIRMARRTARSHHERFDGNGYPDGLAGEDIPLEARIVAVADTIDAMTHDRPYRDALPVTTAIETIKEEAGAQFDPQVSQATLRIRESVEEFL